MMYIASQRALRRACFIGSCLGLTAPKIRYFLEKQEEKSFLTRDTRLRDLLTMTAFTGMLEFQLLVEVVVVTSHSPSSRIDYVNLIIHLINKDCFPCLLSIAGTIWFSLLTTNNRTNLHQTTE